MRGERVRSGPSAGESGGGRVWVLGRPGREGARGAGPCGGGGKGEPLRAGPEKEVGRGEEGEAGRVKEKRSWAWLRKWAEAGWVGLRVLSLFPIPFLFPILFYS